MGNLRYSENESFSHWEAEKRARRGYRGSSERVCVGKCRLALRAFSVAVGTSSMESLELRESIVAGCCARLFCGVQALPKTSNPSAGERSPKCDCESVAVSSADITGVETALDMWEEVEVLREDSATCVLAAEVLTLIDMDELRELVGGLE